MHKTRFRFSLLIALIALLVIFVPVFAAPAPGVVAQGEVDWSAEILLSLVGVVTSLVFAYFPWVSSWFDSLDSRWKPLVNVGVLLLVTIGRLLILCQFATACLAIQWQSAAVAFIMAVVANQATYQVTVRQFKIHAARMATLRRVQAE